MALSHLHAGRSVLLMNTNTGNLDAWGRPIMQAWDGHGAWNCNNYDCTEHPQSMYPNVESVATETVALVCSQCGVGNYRQDDTMIVFRCTETDTTCAHSVTLANVYDSVEIETDTIVSVVNGVLTIEVQL